MYEEVESNRRRSLIQSKKEDIEKRNNSEGTFSAKKKSWLDRLTHDEIIKKMSIIFGLVLVLVKTRFVERKRSFFHELKRERKTILLTISICR